MSRTFKQRNPVARHDFNRASVHKDRKAEYVPSVEEGLDDFESETDPLFSLWPYEDDEDDCESA